MDFDSTGAVAMDREEIQATIPHRAPFLFVDRVAELTSERIVSEWTVAPSAAFFQGHYPGNPIVPGVLLNEFVFQSAAIFMAKLDAVKHGAAGVPVLTRIQDARFKRMVRPGEVLQAETTLTERLGPACYMRSTVRSGGQKVLMLNFTVALAAAEVAP